MKIAVFGAGVSGLSIAQRLKQLGFEAVVYEKDKQIGGLAKTKIVDGYVYDIHGGHIFNSKNPEVVNWVFSFLPKNKWKLSKRNAKIFFDGTIVSYPFELALGELNKDKAISYALDLITSRQGKEPTNFKDWLVWNFGKGIANAYMLPYNKKIWAYPLEKMGTKWIRGKMPLPSNEFILKSLINNNHDEKEMVHSTFYYPLKNGIQTMIDAIAKGLTILTETPVTSCEQLKNKKWLVNGKEEYDLVINTMPLPELVQVLKMPPSIKKAVLDLKYNSLTTVLFSCPKTDISWLYIPGEKYPMHRVGYQSALTPYAVPDNKQGSGAFEIIGKKFTVKPDIIKLLPKELKAKKILASAHTKYAYVVHDKNYEPNMKKINTYFDKVANFYLLGRWGRWNYKNMDLCIKDSLDLAQNIKEKYADRKNKA